jgi:NAD(P)H-dependent flavin oxidoreductase YrpB (nitropropane dioxygenase family)
MSQFALTVPVLAAPMAGGPSTPAMVVAAGRAGALGMLAAGYKTPEAVAAQIAAVRAESVPFGLNVFAPNPVPVNPDAYRAYASAMQREADRFGLQLPAAPIEDDDQFAAKIDLLLSDPIPIVGFTFGIPGVTAPEPIAGKRVIADLQAAGTVVIQTVTTPQEASQAAQAGVDMIAVQASTAGGHSGTFTPGRPVPATPIAGCEMRSSTPMSPAPRWVTPPSTTSPAHCANRPRLPAKLTSFTCGPGPATATRPSGRPQRSWLAWPGSSDG